MARASRGIILAALFGITCGASQAGAAPTEDETLQLQADEWVARGRLSEAEPVYRRALTAAQQAHGIRSSQVFRLTMVLVRYYTRLGRLDLTERHLRRALVICAGPSNTASLGLDFIDTQYLENSLLAKPENLAGTPDGADVLEGFANLYLARGWDADAERVLKRSIEIHQVPANVLFPGLSEADRISALIRTLNLISIIQDRQGKALETESSLRRALALQESASGTSDPQVAAQLSRLGAFLRSQNRASEAEPLESHAKEILDQQPATQP